MKNTIFGTIFLLAYIGMLIGAIFFASALVDLIRFFCERVNPISSEVGRYSIALVGFAFVPMGLFQRSRKIAGHCVEWSSYLYGVALWITAYIALHELWGTMGVISGMLLFGFGVVPLAIIACMFKTQWLLGGLMCGMLILVFGVRFLGIYWKMDGTTKGLFKWYERLPEWSRWVLFFPLAALLVFFAIFSSVLTKDEMELAYPIIFIGWAMMASYKLAPRWKSKLALFSLVFRSVSVSIYNGYAAYEGSRILIGESQFYFVGVELASELLALAFYIMVVRHEERLSAEHDAVALI